MTDRTVLLSKRPTGYCGRFTAMAGPCELLIDGVDQTLAQKICNIASTEAWRIEDTYSRYRDDNVIHRINTANGAACSANPELAALLNFANTCWQLSDGGFDITSGVLRRAWHFDGGSELPDQSSVKKLLSLVGWHRVNWDGERLQMPANMEIDLGGIGKEFAVDRTIGRIAAVSDVPVLVNFGGDLRCTRAPIATEAWQVGIENHGGSGTNALIQLSAGSLATSGDARRYLLKDGVRYGHVLDPRTGWPVPDAAHSITVARNQCIEAGMLATLALLKGAQAESFLNQQQSAHWIYR